MQGMGATKGKDSADLEVVLCCGPQRELPIRLRRSKAEQHKGAWRTEESMRDSG